MFHSGVKFENWFLAEFKKLCGGTLGRSIPKSFLFILPKIRSHFDNTKNTLWGTIWEKKPFWTTWIRCRKLSVDYLTLVIVILRVESMQVGSMYLGLKGPWNTVTITIHNFPLNIWFKWTGCVECRIYLKEEARKKDIYIHVCVCMCPVSGKEQGLTILEWKIKMYSAKFPQFKLLIWTKNTN